MEQEAQLKKPGVALPTFDLQAVVRSPAFLPGLWLLLGIVAAFWDFWPALFRLYESPDGYYSHGWLVPLIAGYIVYRNWDRLKQGDWLWFLGGLADRVYARWPAAKGMSDRAFWPALALMAFVLLAAYVSAVQKIEGLRSVSLIALLLCAAWVVAGFRWAVALSPAVLYLAFGLPVWTTLINNTTNPLQLASTQVAYQMLRLLGFGPLMFPDDPTVIQLPRFVLDVGVPCSGLKLLLALTAFTVFFMLIARLTWWGNLAMVIMVLPLSLLVNGLRIALIGIVGDLNGERAGIAFHDYSGYITLIICFVVVFKIARLLGWKD